jgi:hypothetical protein
VGRKASGVDRGAGGLGRENGGQVDIGGQPGFLGVRRRVTASARSADLWAGWGVKRPEMGSKWRFFRRLATWVITVQLLFQDLVKSKVASHDPQERNRRKLLLHIDLLRKRSSPNFCRKPENVAFRSMLPRAG